MHKLLLLLFITATALSSRAQYAGYMPIADLGKFKDKFAAEAQKTQTIKSDFVQEKNMSMLSEKIVSKGKFWFKKNNLVRMEYNEPYQYLMIINQDNVFLKDGQKENKISARSNKIFKQINRITMDCVQGTTISNPDFNTKVFENKNSYLVELSPVVKGLKEIFKNINVTIDKSDYSVTNINMHELSGDYTLIRFLKKELNTTIPDALFAIK